MNFIISVLLMLFITGFISWASSVTSKEFFIVNSNNINNI